MHYWPDYGRETDVKRLRDGTEVEHMAEACHLDIGEGSETPLVEKSQQFHGLNHFVPMPDHKLSEKLNDFDFLQQRTESCAKKHSSIAFNLVSVDFWSVGNVVEFVQRQNKARIPTIA